MCDRASLLVTGGRFAVLSHLLVRRPLVGLAAGSPHRQPSLETRAMTDNDLNKTWGVFGILCSVVVYLWFRGRIRLVLSRAENSPSQGDPKDRIVMYGKLINQVTAL